MSHRNPLPGHQTTVDYSVTRQSARKALLIQTFLPHPPPLLRTPNRALCGVLDWLRKAMHGARHKMYVSGRNAIASVVGHLASERAKKAEGPDLSTVMWNDLITDVFAIPQDSIVSTILSPSIAGAPPPRLLYVHHQNRSECQSNRIRMPHKMASFLKFDHRIVSVFRI